MIKRVLDWLRRQVAPVPPELAGCEFGCHVPQCAHGRWEQCVYRLNMRRIAEEPITGTPTPLENEVGRGRAAGGTW